MKKNIFLLLIALCTAALSAQEALKSAEEEYYDFLSLQGLTKRPALNYHTFSDSVWKIDEDTDHLWQGQNLGTFFPLFGDFTMRVYGPELFMSANTAAPYGQNDGVLWQGRGFNALFKGGVRFEGYGVELMLLPHFAFSQNAPFDIMPSFYESEYGYHWGYGDPKSNSGGVDAPQRFGDKPFFDWDFGDSEIRYTWKTLTVGFGTQAIWLGPAQLNPLIHSNNAPSYPKLDIGFRRQPIAIPKHDWYLGDIEFRMWWGYLSESDWFDDDSSNDHNLITGISAAYSFPSILSGLTAGFNLISLAKWDTYNFLNIKSGSLVTDRRISLIFDYVLPVAGINIYFEWGKDDYSPNLDFYLRYPFHTSAYTFGIKKALPVNNNLKGELLLELTGLENSQDYDRVIYWYSTFYGHHVVTQGHTNRGQWLGAGIGTGGNSQYLGFKLYFSKGFGNIFVQRRNPDLDYTWYIDSKNPREYDAESNIRAFIDIGISGQYFFLPNLSAFASFVFRDEHNPLNKSSAPDDRSSAHRYNAYIAASVKYSF